MGTLGTGDGRCPERPVFRLSAEGCEGEEAGAVGVRTSTHGSLEAEGARVLLRVGNATWPGGQREGRQEHVGALAPRQTPLPAPTCGEEGRAWRGLVTSPRSLVFPGFCCRQHQVRSQRGLSHASQRSSRVSSQFYFLFCFARHLKINFYLHKSPRNIFSCENLKLSRQLQAPVPASSLPHLYAMCFPGGPRCAVSRESFRASLKSMRCGSI